MALANKMVQQDPGSRNDLFLASFLLWI